jgi:hypothetical protein
MPRTIHVTKDPVFLDGYQAILKPSQYGYTMMVALTDQNLIERLEQERDGAIEWASSRLKNPNRRVVRPEPWEERPQGGVKAKFTWKEDSCPPIVDSEGTPITDPGLPLYSGSKVRVGFYQKPYILNDKVTIGTSLKLVSVQVVSLENGSVSDSGPMDHEEAAALFGRVDGFRIDEANVEVSRTSDEEELESGSVEF